MYSRYRNKVIRAISPGKLENYWPAVFGPAPFGSSTGYAGITRFKECDDVVSDPPYQSLNPLTLVEYGAELPLRINGSILEGPIETRATKWNPQNRNAYQYAPTTTPVNWQYWSTLALSNLNPSKPKVDLPLFIWEMKDFPEMLKNMGDVLSRRIHPKSIPEGYLSYSFGWAPLVSDLLALFNLAKSIDDRMRYLRKLEKGTHIRRRLGKRVVQHVITSNGYSAGATYPNGQTILRADTVDTEVLRVWFTAQAKLRNKLPVATDMHYLSKRLVLGLRASPSTVWNAVPWSWLIDYFFNVGDVIEATDGILPFDVPSMCIMAESKSTASLQNVRMLPGFTYEGGTMQTVAKRRHVEYSPIPWLTFEPLLTLGQKANLAGLVVARGLGSKGFRTSR